MPIYQYDCAGCGRRVEVFFRSISRVGDPVCPECGGKELTRVISRVARRRTTMDRIENIDITQELGKLDPRDPSSFARWSRRMGREYDGVLGSDFSEIAERANASDDAVDRIGMAHKLRYTVQKARGEALFGPAEPEPDPWSGEGE